ncbi:hypothetical protein JMM59_04485 [Rhodovulum sulfidophilum]|nr:hypothetical protein [Rhodovulum sulfidophilum]
MTDRGVAVSQSARDLDLSESVLRRWMRELTIAQVAAFPGGADACRSGPDRSPEERGRPAPSGA